MNNNFFEPIELIAPVTMENVSGETRSSTVTCDKGYVCSKGVVSI